MIDKRKSLIFALFLVILAVALTLTGRGHFYEVSLFKGQKISKKNRPARC
jgi:hypothetical protein